jgi:transaldolase
MPRPPAAQPTALPDPESPNMTSDIRHDPLAELSAQGVAVWLDDLSRELLASGELQLLITGRYVVGVTTNPTIFASALAKGDRYDAQLSHLAELGASTETAIFTVTTDDVRAACDVLSPVYQQTAATDGRVSIEVDPRLARDAAATADMARALRSAVGRDNMFVKIPATSEGLTAITQATSEGISVNVTLIFALARYRAVMDAYLSGLEQAAAAGRDLAAIRSVASFFISRVDSEVDTRLDQIATSQAAQLKGKAAIANARLAYQAYQAVIASQRWQKLAGLGAQPQRPLWASTGIKNHAYPDTMYVTELVAAGTVNTMPGTTLAAFADHGEVTGNTITGRYHDARRILDQLATAGVDFDDVTGQLEREGLAKFENSWDELSHTIAAELHRNHPARLRSAGTVKPGPGVIPGLRRRLTASASPQAQGPASRPSGHRRERHLLYLAGGCGRSRRRPSAPGPRPRW